MTSIVFVGPSLRDIATHAADELSFKGPARCGDIFRAATLRPRAIGLIDGYFETTAAPWHKELLWALAEGIAVFGGASMGALRAAEMAPFGMIGVGAIYELYRDGALECDDEVAVLHGPPETSYLPLTEPLVNVRATLSALAERGILAPADARAILKAAQALYYKERTWPAILAGAAAAGAQPEALARIAAVLPEAAIDQKAIDARALISRMLASADEPRAVTQPFVHTTFFDALTRLGG